ncbi:MAG: cysteine--tRNA ligase [Bacillota bacterium]|nr:cysteine--tRNA ligase [Bacillota bacterium]
MKLYNSLSRKVEDFEPYEAGKVKMYTCGPTVYNYAHIGNLRTYIHEDVLEKSLELLGYEVTRTMNITDVGHLESDADSGEDKMLKGAKREKKTVWEIAEMYTDAFFADCAKLNIRRPATVRKATDLIKEYIDFIQVLEQKGFTYFAGGNVYFDITKVEDYTKLSKVDLSELQVARRDDVEEDANKKNPHDFVLWFTKSKFDNQEMKWDSPWGIGYPGWHIECSVIALDTLGEELDIHCGGVDHIAVHHTNEIAQTESYTGKDWCKYWWHGEFLVVKEGKMSKSKGEFLTVDVLIKNGYDPLAYRYYVLGSHYRKQLEFTFENLDSAQTAYKKLRKQSFELCQGAAESCVSGENTAPYREKFDAFLADDLNTANALTVLYEVLKSDLSKDEKAALIRYMDQIFALDLDKELKSEGIDEELEQYVNRKIQERAEAKSAKDWALADAIRDELKEKGIRLLDTKDGVKWEKL